MKALEILKHLKKEKFYYLTTSTKDKNVEINNSVLTKAIKELNELKNRSCNNCKHYKQSSNQDYKTCYEIKVNGFNLESKKDFYCNEWESK